MNKLIIFSLLFLSPSVVWAHPGNTDAYGCHTCRTNCPKWGLSTGEYHCHASKGLVQPAEPVRSIKNDSGVGVTVPAPEYKEPIKTVTVPEVKKPVQTSVTVPVSEYKEPVKMVAVPEVKKSVEVVELKNKPEKKSWFKALFSWF